MNRGSRPAPTFLSTTGVLKLCFDVRILLLCDDPPEPQMDALQEFLEGGDLGFELVVEQASQRTLKRLVRRGRPHSVLVYVHGTFRRSVEGWLIDYCLRGGTLVAVHHAVASNKTLNERWLPFNGVTIDRGNSPARWTVVPRGTLELVNLVPGHPVTTRGVEYSGVVEFPPHGGRGQPIPGNAPPGFHGGGGLLPSFALGDTELLRNHQLRRDPDRTPLFGYKFTGASSREVYWDFTGGWVAKRGRGSLFYFLPGHTVGDFRDANFRQVLLNGLTWNRGEPLPTC
ncbi:MAG: hypothetical protein ACTSU5_22065 [Promethearchaeota archaeon]